MVRTVLTNRHHFPVLRNLAAGTECRSLRNITDGVPIAGEVRVGQTHCDGDARRCGANAMTVFFMLYGVVSADLKNNFAAFPFITDFAVIESLLFCLGAGRGPSVSILHIRQAFCNCRASVYGPPFNVTI